MNILILVLFICALIVLLGLSTLAVLAWNKFFSVVSKDREYFDYF